MRALDGFSRRTLPHVAESTSACHVQRTRVRVRVPPLCRMSPMDKSEPRSLSAPYAPSGMTRAVTRSVCGSAFVNGLWRPHTQMRYACRNVYARVQRRLYTQLDSLMTRRIQESNSDDGPGYSQPHAAAPRRNCTPTDRRATYRGHISMRAVTSIHAANYYRKRRNCTRPGNWPSRFDLYSTFHSQGTLRGVVFAKFLTRPPHNPRCAISFWKRTHFALTASRYY